jgi:hypothetical protein
MTIAAVKFDETAKLYYYACDIADLKLGERIEVDTEKGVRPATFIDYVRPTEIGFVPNKKILGRAAKVNEEARGKVTVVKNNRSRRTQKQRVAEARELRKLLQESHPTMLSTKQISEKMNWDLDATPGYIKDAIKLEDKIIHVYKGWYTAKL